MELRKSNYKNIVCPSLICLKARHKLGKVFFSCALPGRTEGNNGGQPNPRSFLGHQKNQNAVKFTNQLYLPLACRKYLSAPNVSPRNSALFSCQALLKTFLVLLLRCPASLSKFPLPDGSHVYTPAHHTLLLLFCLSYLSCRVLIGQP